MRPVRAVDRALKILLFIARQEKPEGLSEIGRQLKLDKATTLRLLFTLESQGLVRQHDETRNYELGPAVSLLAGAAKIELQQFCRPYLEDLWRKTKETICLVCPHGTERTHADVIPAPHELRLVPSVGNTWPIYVGASGRVIMAFMNKAEVERIIKETNLAPRNAVRAPSKKEIFSDIAAIQRSGYLISIGETVEGGAAVAAPVINDRGQVVGAVALRAPNTRASKTILAKFAPMVRDTAQTISKSLGFKQDPLSPEWLASIGWNPASSKKPVKSKSTKRPATK